MKLFSLLLCLLSFNLYAQTINVDYHFANPTVVESGEFQKILIDELPQSITPFKPVLPFMMAKIALPDDFDQLVDLKIKRNNVTTIDGVDNLEIAFPFDEARPLIMRTYEQFDTDVDYPQASDYHSIQTQDNQKFLVVRLNPVFIDNNKRIFSAAKISLSLDFSRKAIKSIDTVNANTLDYLIISTDKIISYHGENSLHQFADFLKDKRNLRVEIVDIEDAKKILPGKDDAESLRNFLRHYHQTTGIKYLLLAGDSDSSNPAIPYRELYAKIRAYNGYWQTIEGSIPSDFYYSCLDGSFNSDNDQYWGESNDGENGNDVDFLCELAVGRWSVDNYNQLTNIVKKTIHAYAIEQRTKNVLMMGEVLFKELNLWGGDYMDQLVGTSNERGFTTHGYNQSWNIDKLYDKDSTWSGKTGQQKINSGNYLIVNHLGHSNKTYNMRLYNRSTKRYSNPNPFFLYTQGCFPGHFIYDDSFIETMHYSENGFFAAVANAHYGLGPEDPNPEETKTPGTSQLLHRFFTNRLLGENQMHFGLAHQKSKEDIIVYIDHPEARWVTWAATFFGDPAL